MSVSPKGNWLGSRWSGCALVLLATLAQRADACGWSWETYAAEAKYLPCVHDVLTGFFATHTEQYHQHMVEASDWALLWAPLYGAALDQKGVSLMHLKQHGQAEEAMLARLGAFPDAYPSHANLGTLYTFTGAYKKALEHIDVAMKMEPDAHFGREGYHRKLVEYFEARRANPSVSLKTDFLQLDLTEEDRLKGSTERAHALGVTNQTFAALSAMITVYGAEGVPEMYVAFGNALAVAGYPRLAFTAYEHAQFLLGGKNEDLLLFQAQLQVRIKAENATKNWGRRPGGDLSSSPARGPDHDIRALSANTGMQAEQARKYYHNWEKARIREGLEVWTQKGIEQVYKKMDSVRARCPVGKMLDPASGPEVAKP